MTGGTAINQIPSSSTVTLRTEQRSSTIKAKLNALAEQFTKKNDGKFRIEFMMKDHNTLEFTVFGMSAHSAEH